MDGEPNSINPWVRANLGTYSDETRELLSPPEQVDYVRIMSRMAIADTRLQDAYLEQQAARQEHLEFMTRHLI